MNPATPQVSTTLNVIPDCYHTTTSENFEIIVNDGFILSQGDDQWLGDGVYFWESTLPTARWWAQHKKFSSWVIVKAELHLGICLNLANSEHTDILQNCKKKLEERGYPKCTDAIVINFLAENIQQIDSVRSSFVYQKSPLYTDSRIKPYNPIVCMRNVKNILSYSVQERG